uniref:Uncharacterized protein n=1 Tax=Amphimedon queenslandica TaxID=400682 RepID=A0A1X7VRG2_AMPQE
MASASSASDSHMDSQEFTFLYSPPDIAKEVDIAENETTQKGRKRKLDPANRKKKHIKTCGLRKISPSLTITDDMECCLFNPFMYLIYEGLEQILKACFMRNRIFYLN